MTKVGDKIVLHTHSPEMTELIGEKLGKALQPGDLVALEGDLGAGKTVLARGLIRGVTGLDVPARSPTFILTYDYPGPIPLRHADLYRLKTPEELETIVLLDETSHRRVTVVEWADRLPAEMRNEAILIRIDDVSETEREISVTARVDIIEKMKSAVA
ncbi:MAG: tRNA (adenosine(37)-N6)-threonylcarbamoyltransferase complex ATPase subunit type 1 TsaE [Nitrospinae bacterium]|nr:tRNA (adenosine(37)-N6)-threonylcarbamoyltransferase complex ATPase subunit type 1 TsaE [Nitrospinota bacterium]